MKSAHILLLAFLALFLVVGVIIMLVIFDEYYHCDITGCKNNVANRQRVIDDVEINSLDFVDTSLQHY
ncbi:uncharacterized protein CELE_R160.13 [Caenorhabditis elegans]|uniref:Uncharacterized protein n=1 Tax=Caenorhabditis elegans TaxID=6239 RepID=A0A5E4M2K2_CAEEL|nr:Uncharacterized protein CELE_R160.13 [Caenorhabditis elegans]VVC12373.1 Uncharacterized protein CELE_R160.13 [Caenorhabditis elegans]